MDKDSERENIAYVNQLLMEYYAAGDESNELRPSYFDALTFLLADLLHYCDSQNLDYNGVMKAAKWHYNMNNNMASYEK